MSTDRAALAVRPHAPIAAPLPIAYGRALALIVAVGALLRLALLARQPLGYDEDFTAAVVHRPLADMLAALSRDSGPPLFYLLERLVSPAGAAPWTLRLVPAIAGIGLVPLVAALGRRLAGDQAGLWSGIAVAFLPAAVMSSENARMYALAAALVVASALLLWRAVERPAAGRWAVWWLAAATAVWTDYFAAPALVAILLGAALLRPPRRVLLAAACGTAVAITSIAPWLVYAHEQLAHGGGSFWVPPLAPDTVVGTLAQLVAGPPVDAGVPFREALIALQLVAIAAILVALGYLAIHRRPGADPSAAQFCFVAGTAGAVALAVVSLWRPLFEARYASVTWLPLLAFVGLGLARLPRLAALACAAALLVPSLALGLVTTHAETTALLPEVEVRLGAHDVVAASPNGYLALLDGADPAVASRLHVLSASDLPWYFGTAAYPPGAVLREVPADVTAHGGRVLFVGGPDETPAPLPAGYHATERICRVRACLTVFAP